MATVQLTLSPSEAKAWRRCKRQYYYKCVEKLEARRPDPKLKFGTWEHKLMQAHYSGKDWHEEHRRQLKAFNNLFLEEREYYGDLPDRVELAMEGYLFHWRKEEEDWEILHTEEVFHYEDETGVIFSFKPDLIVKERSTKRIWVVDHKTVRSLPDADWRIEDIQSTIYGWALNQLGVNPYGFIFNYIRQKSPSIPHINKDGSISKAKIDTDYYTMSKFLLEYYEVDSVNKLPHDYKVRLQYLRLNNTYYRRSRVKKSSRVINRQVYELRLTAGEIREWMQLHTVAKKRQADDPWVRTTIPACEWDCDFRELCVAELLGSNVDFIRRNRYRPSEYYKERERGRKAKAS